MKIFNLIISGRDEQRFCSLSTDDKVEWIKAHTNQTNEVLIYRFLESKKKGKCDCGCSEPKRTNSNFVTQQAKKTTKRKK